MNLSNLHTPKYCAFGHQSQSIDTWLVLMASYHPGLLLSGSIIYKPFYFTIFVYCFCVSAGVCSFVSRWSGGEPVAELDLQFIVESEPLDPKFINMP